VSRRCQDALDERGLASWRDQRARKRGLLLALGLLLLGLSAPLACGDLGEPAFAGLEGGATAYSPPPASDASDEKDGAPPTVLLAGTVRNPSGEPIVALVAIEVGGLNQENPGAVGPDGGVQPTLKIDPFYQYGTRTDDAGEFSLEVPEGELGVHVYASGFYCGVPEAGAIDPSSGTTKVVTVLRPLLKEDGGMTPAQPTITGFTITPQVAAPGATLTMAAEVEAVDPSLDPLSEEVLAIEPTSSWAGIFAPPVPGTPGVAYPNGVYGRLAVAPAALGEYVYYLVAATEACVVSQVAVARVLVTPTGEGGIDGTSPALPQQEEDAEAGSEPDAAADAGDGGAD
jgi:hypothetical protein